MKLHPHQEFSLLDRQGSALGRVEIERVQGDLVFGRFTPGPAYAAVEPLFTEYVAAANEQVLSIVGQLDARIAGLGLHPHSAAHDRLPVIHDVQIGDGTITFRFRSLTEDFVGTDGTARTCHGLPKDSGHQQAGNLS